MSETYAKIIWWLGKAVGSREEIHENKLKFDYELIIVSA